MRRCLRGGRPAVGLGNQLVDVTFLFRRKVGRHSLLDRRSSGAVLERNRCRSRTARASSNSSNRRIAKREVGRQRFVEISRERVEYGRRLDQLPGRDADLERLLEHGVRLRQEERVEAEFKERRVFVDPLHRQAAEFLDHGLELEQDPFATCGGNSLSVCDNFRD